MSYFYEKLEDPKFYKLKTKIGKIFTLGRNPLKEYMLKQVKLDEGDKVLDVGCGIGTYALFPGYTGVDINKEYIEDAKKNHQGTFLAMDSANLEFPDESFDYVFNMSLFHHITDAEVEQTIKEMQRVCKKGGKVLIMDAVLPSRFNLIGYNLFKLDRGQYTRTLDELKTLLSKYNFKLLTKDVGGSFLYQFATFIYQK